MRLGLSWTEAATVVVSTIGIYLTFLVLIRIVGQRAFATMSNVDFAAAVPLGAVVRRVIVGYTPTPLAGVMGLSTLFALQALFGIVRPNPRADTVLSNLPLMPMTDGCLLDENLRKGAHRRNELREKLRLAGVRRDDDVACVILERTGAIRCCAAARP